MVSLIIQLGEFTDKQILQYVDKYKRLHPTNKFIKKVGVILKSKQYKHIHELLRQAVLIYFIANADIDLDTKDSKAIIYDKIFNTLAERAWDKNGQLDFVKPKMRTNPQLYQKHLRDLVRNLAFEIHQSKNLYITLEKLLQLESTQNFIKKCFNEDLSESPEKLKDIGKYLLVSFYFQEVQNTHETAIEFFHNSLWEFLTAEYMWNENKKLLLQPDQDDEGDYIAVTKEEYFTLVNKLVGNKAPSYTIKINIAELIENDNDEAKASIVKQLKPILEKLVKDDFLLDYRRQDNQLTSFEKSIKIFEIIWVFYWYSNLSTDNIVFIDEKLGRYVFNYSYDYCAEFDFINTVIDGGMDYANLSDNNSYKNVTLLGELFHCEIHVNKFEDCKISAAFHSSVLYKNHFTNVDFNDSFFGSFLILKENTFNNCIFDDVQFESQNLVDQFLNNNSFVPNFNSKYWIEELTDTIYGYKSYKVRHK
jgi:hypothetical protein